MNRDIIIGVGSHHGDDQVGWLLIDRLVKDGFSNATLRIVNDPIDILAESEGASRLVIVDACRSGGQLGTITRLTWTDHRAASQHDRSSHSISLINALQLAKTLGRLPEQIVLYGVEVGQCNPQTDLSPSVLDSLPELALRVANEVLLRSDNASHQDSTNAKMDA